MVVYCRAIAFNFHHYTTCLIIEEETMNILNFYQISNKTNAILEIRIYLDYFCVTTIQSNYILIHPVY